MLAYKTYSKLLPCSTRPYRVISVAPEYVENDYDDIRNTVWINRLTRVAEEKMTKMEIVSDSKSNTDTSPVQESSIEEMKNSYAVEKMLNTGPAYGCILYRSIVRL